MREYQQDQLDALGKLGIATGLAALAVWGHKAGYTAKLSRSIVESYTPKTYSALAAVGSVRAQLNTESLEYSIPSISKAWRTAYTQNLRDFTGHISNNPAIEMFSKGSNIFGLPTLLRDLVSIHTPFVSDKAATMIYNANAEVGLQTYGAFEIAGSAQLGADFGRVTADQRHEASRELFRYSINADRYANGVEIKGVKFQYSQLLEIQRNTRNTYGGEHIRTEVQRLSMLPGGEIEQKFQIQPDPVDRVRQALTGDSKARRASLYDVREHFAESLIKKNAGLKKDAELYARVDKDVRAAAFAATKSEEVTQDFMQLWDKYSQMSTGGLFLDDSILKLQTGILDTRQVTFSIDSLLAEFSNKWRVPIIKWNPADLIRSLLGMRGKERFALVGGQENIPMVHGKESPDTIFAKVGKHLYRFEQNLEGGLNRPLEARLMTTIDVFGRSRPIEVAHIHGSGAFKSFLGKSVGERGFESESIASNVLGLAGRAVPIEKVFDPIRFISELLQGRKMNFGLKDNEIMGQLEDWFGEGYADLNPRKIGKYLDDHTKHLPIDSALRINAMRFNELFATGGENVPYKEELNLLKLADKLKATDEDFFNNFLKYTSKATRSYDPSTPETTAFLAREMNKRSYNISKRSMIGAGAQRTGKVIMEGEMGIMSLLEHFRLSSGAEVGLEGFIQLGGMTESNAKVMKELGALDSYLYNVLNWEGMVNLPGTNRLERLAFLGQGNALKEAIDKPDPFRILRQFSPQLDDFREQDIIVKRNKTLFDIMGSLSRINRSGGTDSTAGILYDVSADMVDSVMSTWGIRTADYGTSTLMPHYFAHTASESMEYMSGLLGIRPSNSTFARSPLTLGLAWAGVAVGAGTALSNINALDLVTREMGFRGPRQFMMDSWVNANLILGAVTGKYNETLDYYRDGEEEVRAGRWWSLGSTPFEGGRIKYTVPNLYRRVGVRSEYYEQKWGSELKALAHSGYPTFLTPLAPLRHFLTDRYYYERLHDQDNPVPLTGEFMDPNIPGGSFLNMAAGWLLKPQFAMHRDEMAMMRGASGTDLSKGDYFVDMSTATSGGRDSNRSQTMYGGHGVGAVRGGPSLGSNRPIGVMNNWGLNAMGNVSSQGAAEARGLVMGANMAMTTGDAEQPQRMGIGDITSPFGAALKDMSHSNLEIAGIWGYYGQRLSGLDRGSYRMQTGRAGYSLTEDIRSAEIGSWIPIPFLGELITEIPRRIVKAPRQLTYNPLRNDLPQWLPEKYRYGNVYDKTPYGYYKLPGKTFEALNNVNREKIGGSSIGLPLNELVEKLSGFGRESTSSAEEAGTEFHSTALKELLASGTIIASEKPIDDRMHNMYGYIDAVMEINGKPMVIDLKTTNAVNMEKIRRGEISEAYKSQINYYMWAMQTTMGALYFVNRDDPQDRILWTMQYEEQRMKDDFRKLEKARAMTANLIQQGFVSPYESYRDIDRAKVLVDVDPYSDEFQRVMERLSNETEKDITTAIELDKIKKKSQRIKAGLTFDEYLWKNPTKVLQHQEVLVNDDNTITVNYSMRGKRNVHTGMLAGVMPVEGYEKAFGEILRNMLAQDSLEQVRILPEDNDSKVILFTRGGNSVAQQLIDMHVGVPVTSSRQEDREAMFAHQGNYAWEWATHLDTPLHTKLGKASALEEYKRREVYGTRYTSPFLSPIAYTGHMIKGLSGHDNLIEAAIGGASGGALLGSPTGKNILRNMGKGAIYGAVAAVVLSGGRQIMDEISGDTWIPAEETKVREIEEYIDRLKYVKFKRLFESTNKMLEGVGINLKSIANMVMGGDNPDTIIANYPRFGDLIKKGLFYKQEFESTVYALDRDSDTRKVLRALPKRERQYYLAFKNYQSKDRKDVLKIVSPSMRKALAIAWGEDMPDGQRLNEFFRDHTLPSPSWEGWSPDTNIQDYKVVISGEEGVNYHELGSWEDAIQRTRSWEAQPSMHKSFGTKNLKTRLYSLFNKHGLEDIQIDIVRSNNTNDIDVNLNIREDISDPAASIFYERNQ